MAMIPTRVHGVLDYLTAIVLIAAPWLLGFADGGPAQWIPVLLGFGIILYSLMTDYEWGALRELPMPVHLGMDAAGGVLLAASPWLFGFSHLVIWPHVLVGLFEIAAALVTERHAPHRARA